MCESDAETATGIMGNELQRRLVRLTHFAGDIQPQSGTLVLGRCKRLKQAIGDAGIQSSPGINEIEERTVVARVDASLEAEFWR